jgi:mannose-6-phosphate isomerase
LDQLPALYRRFDDWMQAMLPVWTGAAWNPAAGTCAELIGDDLKPLATEFHRLIVAGRQLVVFAHAHRRWGDKLAAERARAIAGTLRERFWDVEHGGWYFTIDAHGRPLDTRKDLYSHAFGMLGLATYAATFDDDQALTLARAADSAIEAKLKQPGGWLAAEADRGWAPKDGLLRQNPHMHLFEAYVALYAATGEAVWSEKAQALLRLIADKVAHPQTGALRELLDGDARPTAEPGHHFEWYWLIAELARLDPAMRCPLDRERLYGWAAEYGIDEDGGVLLSVDAETGAPVDDRKRLWGVTELIKAQAAYARAHRDGFERDRLAGDLGFLLERHLKPGGGWHEYLARDLTPIAGPMPTSSGYHLMLALVELEQVVG